MGANWLRERLAWAQRNPLFWWNGLFSLLITANIFWWRGPVLESGPSDLRVRVLGMVLQLIGVLTVWWDIRGTRRDFGQSSFMRNTLNWLRELTRRNVIVGAGSVALEAAMVRGRGRGWFGNAPGATLAQRLHNAERNLESLGGEITSLQSELDAEVGQLKTELKQERRARETQISSISEKIATTATGNSALLAFGAFWLAVGVVLATLAPEIVRCAAGLCAEIRRAM